MSQRLLIAGTSVRAAADSAVRAGFQLTALDAYADLDQQPCVRALSMPRDFHQKATPWRMARAAREVDADAVVYLSPFENHPQAVAALARNRPLLGNAPDILRRVRDPLFVYETLRRHAIPAAAVRAGGIDRHDLRDDHSGWMVKPLASGGGRGVRPWRPGSRLPAGCYLQERIDGIVGSVTFVAAGGRCSVLGVSRQLTGDEDFGADGCRYCGSMMSLDVDDGWDGDSRVMAGARALAEATSALFDLVGVNGVDFVVRDGVPVAIEVNPRWSASMELVDRTSAVPVMAAHVESCTSGDASHFRRQHATGVLGKAIVFARTGVIVGDTRRWLERGDVRDVPWHGTSIAGGEPICTVFATGATFVECRAALAASAEAIYAAVRP